MIRRILVNYARTRRTAKRGGAQATLVLDEAIAASGSREVDLEALAEALEHVTKL